MCVQQDVILIKANQCPVCLKKCGHKSPRHAMMSHIRRSADPVHVVWRAKNWHSHFPHGRFRTTTPSAHQLMKAIEHEYGIHVLSVLANEIESYCNLQSSNMVTNI